MKLATLQQEYAEHGCGINYRAGIYYITRRDKPTMILKRYALEAVSDVISNVTMLNEYIEMATCRKGQFNVSNIKRGGEEMKCPKCGKRLKTIIVKGEKWYSHTYPLVHVMSDKPMCDYSQKLKTCTPKDCIKCPITKTCLRLYHDKKVIRFQPSSI